MGRNWSAPGPASTDFALSDFVGQLAIVAVGGFEPGIATQYGERDSVRATVVILTGEKANEVYSDVLIFNSRVVSRFRSAPGSVVLGAIVWGEGKGNQPPIDLIDAGPSAYTFADAWEAANPGRLDQLVAQVVASHEAEARRGQQPQQQQGNGRQQPRQDFSNQHQGWKAQVTNQGPPPAWATPVQQSAPAQPTPPVPTVGQWGQGPIVAQITDVPPASREQAGF